MSTHPSYTALAKSVKQKYPHIITGRLWAEIERISMIASDTHDLVNRRILDLGCGSVKSTEQPWNIVKRTYNKLFDKKSYEQFHPWYCRILHEAGAFPVGIDIAGNEKEAFENHTMDLSRTDALTTFDDESFDAVSNDFFTVPRTSIHAKHGGSPGLLISLLQRHRPEDTAYFQAKEVPLSDWGAAVIDRNMHRMWEINDAIFEQVQRVLKDGGVYTLAEQVFKKRKGVLKRDGRMCVL